jgi:RNA polymerase sigma-70 factor (ECF subfamily)
MLRNDPLANPEPLIRRVYSFVAYRLGDGPDAEDVTNDTFERALRYRSSYDRSKGAPITWLLGIARRCIDDALSNRLPIAEPPELAGPGHEEDSLRKLELNRAIASLGERDQELLALRYGADLSARQIAELLEQKTNAVEVALHRALERLRRQLERRETPPETGENPVSKKGVRIQADPPV